MFIRPHHKKQYKKMLNGLVGRSVSAADGPAISEDQQTSGKELFYLLYIIINILIIIVL